VQPITITGARFLRRREIKIRCRSFWQRRRYHFVIVKTNPEGILNVSRWCKPPAAVQTNSKPQRGVVDESDMSSTHLSLHYHIVFGTKIMSRSFNVHGAQTFMRTLAESFARRAELRIALAAFLTMCIC
jgi:hypothetical protein